MNPINKLGALFIEVPVVIDGKPRPDVSIKIGEPTPQQLAVTRLNRSRLIELRSRINDLQSAILDIEVACPHDVCYDVPGYIYDERFCAGCDKHKGSV